MNTKKGIAPIIAFIMIMALAVTIGTFVMTWYTKAAEKQTETTISKYASSEECSEVKFDVAFDYDNCAAIIYNLGSFKIDSVKVDRLFGAVMKSDIWNTGWDAETCSEPLVAPCCISGGLVPKNGCAIPLNRSDPDRIPIPDLELTEMQFVPMLGKDTDIVQCLNDKVYKLNITKYQPVYNPGGLNC